MAGARRSRRGAGRHVRSLLLGPAGAGDRDRLGEGLGGRRRQAAHPGRLDLLDPLGLRLASLAFEFGMPGQRSVLSMHRCWGASGECTRGGPETTWWHVAYPSRVSLYTLDDPRDLIAPVLIAAFDGWVDAGSAATTALAILADDGTPVATFDADQLFDYRARRPPLEIVDGRLTELTWPSLVLRRTRLDERDVLVPARAGPTAWRSRPA